MVRMSVQSVTVLSTLVPGILAHISEPEFAQLQRREHFVLSPRVMKLELTEMM